MNEEDKSLNSVLINDGHPLQEFIVAFDFDYCDVSYEGYRILSRDEISILSSQLEKDCEVGTLNMPGSWSEEFHISKLDGAFVIHSDKPKDIANMRELFGDSVGETGYFDLILYDMNGDEDGEEGEGLRDQPTHIDLQKAREFMECPEEVSLEEAVTIDLDAAKLLATHQGDLLLNSITELSDAAAEALSEHEGGLCLLSIKHISDNAAAILANHQGFLCLAGLTSISDATAEALSNHQDILDLDGLTELSDAAAEHLSHHQGFLILLSGLTEISDAAAASLAKYEGGIYLNGLRKLSAESLDALANKPDTINGENPKDWAEQFRQNMES